MSIVTIWDDGDRRFIARLVARAKPGSRIQIMPPKHTDAQERKLRVLLSEVAEQLTHKGQRYNADQWLALFLHACGQEYDFMPSLDGETMIPYGGHTSQMGVADASALIEFILAWGTQHGAEFDE